jgi:hypothetical protein
MAAAVMPFQASASFLGLPSFDRVDIDVQQVAIALQPYLDSASKITGVSLDNIDRRVSKLPTDVKTVTLVELLALGMKMFDALVWLHAGRPATHPLSVDPTITPATIPSMSAVARSIFFVYFILLTQARYPPRVADPNRSQVPNFLRTIMGLTEPPEHYMAMLCSFEPQLFDPAWVRYVSFARFGQEALSRFGLGSAGYRTMGPFKLYEPKPDMDPALLPAFQFARTVAKAKASWDIHPLTRSPNVLTKRGNLNKNMGNLALECFTQAQLQEMVTNKVLFKIPERQPGHIEYKTWTADDDITGTAFIFN